MTDDKKQDGVDEVLRIWNSDDEFLPLKHMPKLFEIIRIQHEALKWGAKCYCDCNHSLENHECIEKTNRIAKEILK